MLPKLRAWIRITLGFSRSEINGLLILLPLTFFIMFTPTIARKFRHPPLPDTVYLHRLDSIVSTWNWADTMGMPKLFPFDPNQLASEGFVQLGLSEKLADRILNYRSKGGRFRTKADFKKIYGMDSVLFARLSPFVKLPDSLPSIRHQQTTRSKAASATLFDINTADTTQLKTIYGIGSTRALRIIKFRNRLGGFVSLNQLYEVYGLDSTVVAEVLRKVTIEKGFHPQLIALNTASEEMLSQHPYIQRKLATAIAAYRFQHGSFQSVDDLQKIVGFEEGVFHKIKPYLSLD